MSSPATADSEELERALERAVTRFDDGSATSAQMRYHLGIGDATTRGKRLRSRLCLAVAREEGGTLASALDPACAVELVHEYALVHDDIEDGDAIRRGRDAFWARFGLAHGINAGDALCAVGYLALLDGTVERPPEQTAAMTRALLEAQLATCAGAAREIASRELALRARAAVDPQERRARIGCKQGALYGAAAAVGALSAGADAARAAAYARLGSAFGVALVLPDAASLDALDALTAEIGPAPDGALQAFLTGALANGYAARAAKRSPHPPLQR
jgi:geranylgeranyl diphosphate synthase, type I